MREFDARAGNDLSEEYRRGLGSLCAGYLANN